MYICAATIKYHHHIKLLLRYSNFHRDYDYISIANNYKTWVAIISDMYIFFRRTTTKSWNMSYDFAWITIYINIYFTSCSISSTLSSYCDLCFRHTSFMLWFSILPTLTSYYDLRFCQHWIHIMIFDFANNGFILWSSILPTMDSYYDLRFCQN